MNEQFGGKTQAVSITAAIVYGNGSFICSKVYQDILPVPVLTAIVISALMNVVETASWQFVYLK